MLAFLCQHNMKKDNFCLMNDDKICKDIDQDCWTLGRLTEPISSGDFPIGGFIDFNHKGSSLEKTY